MERRIWRDGESNCFRLNERKNQKRQKQPVYSAPSVREVGVIGASAERERENPSLALAM
jgi:hypothetical protein